jgi:hypothetical protein
MQRLDCESGASTLWLGRGLNPKRSVEGHAGWERRPFGDDYDARNRIRPRSSVRGAGSLDIGIRNCFLVRVCLLGYAAASSATMG